MRGRRGQVARVMESIGAVALVRQLRRWTSSVVPILAYHRVLDVDEATFPFDVELISASTSSFEAQVAHIAAHPIGSRLAHSWLLLPSRALR